MACRHMTILLWNVMGSTTILDELKQVADREQPCVIVLTETKLTDSQQDSRLIEPFLPKYTLFHSSQKGTETKQCRSGSGGVTVAVHNSLTTQNSVEVIDHNHPAAKTQCKALKIQPPGSDCLTI